MTPGILSLLFAITFSLSRVLAVRPNILTAVSNATCQPEYAWMNNAEQKDPCLTVAYVIGACVGDSKSLRFWDLCETQFPEIGQLGHNLLCLPGTRMIHRMVRRPLLVTGKPSQVWVSILVHRFDINSSWSCYNLMMACTLCQNPAYTSEIKT